MANGEIVFYGTAAIGLPILRELHTHYRLSLIVTQPDAHGGRNRQLLISPSSSFALENNLPLIQPPSLREPGLSGMIGRNHPGLGRGRGVRPVHSPGLVFPAAL